MTSKPTDALASIQGFENARRERLLVAISDAAIAFAASLALFYLVSVVVFFSWQIGAALLLTLSIVPIGLYSRHLGNKGESIKGSYFLLAAIGTIITTNLWFMDGLFQAIAPPLLMLIIVAGMLLGPRAGYVAAFAGGLFWLTTIGLLNAGIRPSVSLPEPVADIAVAATILLAFVFTALLIQLSVRDLRRALEDATKDLILANKRLEEVSQLKSQFTARTSHELRSPLSAIMVFTDLMQRKAYGPLTEKQMENLTRIMRGAKRINSQISDILDLSKIEAGELQIVREPVTVTDLVENISATQVIAAQEKGLVFSCEVDDRMPVTILGDENRLTQVLVNLVDNAIKFTEEGRVDLRIRPAADNTWQMTVLDTGRGIPEEQLEWVFEEFHRAGESGAAARIQGTGLGLAITKHLVRQMGGQIGLSSVVGEGTVLEVTMPLLLADGQNQTPNA